jgi:hypothetical protein
MQKTDLQTGPMRPACRTLSSVAGRDLAASPGARNCYVTPGLARCTRHSVRPSAVRLNCPIVADFEDSNIKALANSGRHAKSCSFHCRRDYDCVLCGGPGIFHSPQELAIHRVHVQANRWVRPLASA